MRFKFQDDPWCKEEACVVGTPLIIGLGGPTTDQCQWLIIRGSFPAHITVKCGSVTEVLFYEEVIQKASSILLLCLPSLRILEFSTGSSVSKGRMWKESKRGGPWKVFRGQTQRWCRALHTPHWPELSHVIIPDLQGRMGNVVQRDMQERQMKFGEQIVRPCLTCKCLSSQTGNSQE